MSEASGALAQRIDAIEEAYEYCLAYAAQGRSDDEGGRLPIRRFLEQAAKALDGIADSGRQLVEQGELQPREAQLGFLALLEQDAERALAAVNLVLAQRSIGSQLVDNLNASLHLRTLLTDLFLVDETRKQAARAG